MMVRRQTIVLRVAALAVAVLFPLSALAQQAKPNQPKRSKQEQADIDAVVKLLDDVIAGQPAPTDIQMTLTPFYFKSQEKRTFVPFTLDLTNAPADNALLCVRIVTPGLTPDPKTKKVEYPWEDLHFLTAADLASGKLQRALMASPGPADVYIAVRQRLPEKAPKTQVAKVGVLKTQLTVPDFWGTELATSTVMLVGKVNTLSAALSPEEGRARPFAFGPNEFLPATTTTVSKADHLNIFYQIYNVAPDPQGKPSITIEYNFHRTEGGAEKFFNKTNPRTIGGADVPPTFDTSKYPVPETLEIPLTSFPEGEYRLEIKVTDKVSSKTLTRDVKFTVKGA